MAYLTATCLLVCVVAALVAGTKPQQSASFVLKDSPRREQRPPFEESAMLRSDVNDDRHDDNIAVTLSHPYTELSYLLLTADPEGFKSSLTDQILDLAPNAVVPELIDAFIASLQHPSVKPENFLDAVQTFITAVAAKFHVKLGLERRNRLFGRVGEPYQVAPQEFIDAVNSEISECKADMELAKNARMVAQMTQALSAMVAVFSAPCCCYPSCIATGISCSVFWAAWCANIYTEKVAISDSNDMYTVLFTAQHMIARRKAVITGLRNKHSLKPLPSL